MNQLHRVSIGDAPAAWRAAGFAVDETNTTVIGRTSIELVGAHGPRGIRS
ncbi:MAG: hypothetical protein HKN26_09625, partial [Acidimicrobiales bacterium]|nr:hypothetical protein [Acidimicrobiales bacterium]